MSEDGELIEYEGEEVHDKGFQEYLVSCMRGICREIATNKKIRDKILLAYMTGNVNILGLILVDSFSE